VKASIAGAQFDDFIGMVRAPGRAASAAGRVHGIHARGIAKARTFLKNDSSLMARKLPMPARMYQ
jgi:hypothetical protein